MPFQTRAKIITNTEVAKNYFRMTLGASHIPAAALPGQFVQVRVSNAVHPLLRRPFGIHRIRKNSFDILYEVVGEATKLLSTRQSGEILDIIGPLGNGFDLRRERGQNPLVLVAGGMGVAPLLFLAERLAAQRGSGAIKPFVYLGAKTGKGVICKRDFTRLGCKVMVSTDDGSAGFKGYVSGLLAKEFSGFHRVFPAQVYACGPGPMLKAVAALCKKEGFPLQVSLEEHMACGIGACLGCVVDTRQGLQRVCKEGPVFDAQEIVW